VATGNGNTNVIDFPGNYHPILTVGGTDRNDHRWEDSVTPAGANYGSTIDISAPAQDLNSCYYSINFPNNHTDYSTSLAELSKGTSFAAPIVAGVAALMKSINPCISVEDMQAIIKGTAFKANTINNDYDYNWDWERPGHCKDLGYGRLDAAQAVTKASELVSINLDYYLRDLEDDYGQDLI
jgi:subtilisin family serine protease